MTTPITVAKDGEIANGKAITAKVGGEEVAVFNLGGAYYACSNRCPHAGAPLQNAFVSGTVLTCSWHGWRFDLAAGPDTPKDGVTRYRVTVEDGNILVHPPDSDA